MSSSALSDSTQNITSVIFGLTATIISVVTVWQGHRAWKMWRKYSHEHGSVAPDLELGIQSSRSTNTSLEASEHDGAAAGSDPPAYQVGEGAEPHHISASAQGLELQTTSSTAIDTETSLNPASVQGAQVDSNGLRQVSSGSTQPVEIDLGHRDFRPTAGDP